MTGLAIDNAAWETPWRDHGLGGKAFLSGGLLALTFIFPTWPASLFVVVVVVGLLIVSAGTSGAVLARSVAAPLTFIMLSSVAVAVTIHSQPTWSIELTSTSVAAAADVAGRAIAGTMAVLLLALTTPMVDLMSGLRRMGVPAACVEVASLVYRLLFIVLDATRTIRRSQTARLGNTSMLQTLRSSGALTATVLIRSWDQARRLERGLAGRGYVNELPTLDDPPPTTRSFMIATFVALGAVVLASSLIGGMR